mmetsp:Transcript_4589/g.5195  ORF Transcript_4589/g.5195 Transcript_4589/m.5195 type:complete len:97 (+) Transcript_4589:76-366(+)
MRKIATDNRGELCLQQFCIPIVSSLSQQLTIACYTIRTMVYYTNSSLVKHKPGLMMPICQSKIPSMGRSTGIYLISRKFLIVVCSLPCCGAAGRGP